MGDDTPTHGLMSLIAARKQALAADQRWVDYTDGQTIDAYAEIEKLQVALLASDFSKPDHRLMALDLLLDGEDRPNFADDFKNRLFEILQTLVGDTGTTDA